MLDENNNPIMSNTPDATPPEEGSNRTFLIVGGIMAGLVFLTLVCMAVYFLVIAPRTGGSSSLDPDLPSHSPCFTEPIPCSDDTDLQPDAGHRSEHGNRHGYH
jgi:hypothetical protein